MKGSVMDVFAALVILTVAAISLIAYAYTNGIIMNAFVSNFQNNTQFNESVQKVRTYSTNTFNTFNYGFLFLYVGILAAIAILDYYVYASPLFFPFSIILIVVSIFLAMTLANVYWDFCNASADIQAVCNQFNIVTFIMKNLPFFDFIYCVVITFVMYGIKGNRPQINLPGR